MLELANALVLMLLGAMLFFPSVVAPVVFTSLSEAQAERTASGRRVYDDARVDQLRFIRHARDLGFPVDSVRGLIRLQQQPGDDCANADRLATSHLQEVRDRIRQLRALEEELERMIASCQGGAIAQCQIMASLGDHGKCSGEH